MELWVLGAGAMVLIMIAFWLVWPARTADAFDSPVPGEEVSTKPMSGSEYTNATGDLSAGGVASTMQTKSEPWSAPTMPREGFERTPADSSVPMGNMPAMHQPHMLGLGAGALLSVGGAVGGAWLYARWQRERNKPINRMRRGARDMAGRLAERMPDELPVGAAPMSGAATAMLLATLLASRALRRDASPTQRTDDLQGQARELIREALSEAFGRGREALERGREMSPAIPRQLERARTGASAIRADNRRPAFMGLGIGGLAAVVGGTYIVWRILRPPAPDRAWQVGH
jgi:hypothetical protein